MKNFCNSLLYIAVSMFTCNGIKKNVIPFKSAVLSTYMLRGLIYLFCCLQISISNEILSDAKIRERSDQCAAVHWAPPLNGKKLITIALSSEKTSDIKDCVLKCFTTNGCVSLNFGPRKGKHRVCELLKTDRHFLFSNFTDTPGWTYVEKQVWNFKT